ncbi:MAG TPA: (d)CMP kinase [Blastocatellia bacterium]|nr:(d)CMP kinase [Blastocatellia bacterium]
MQKLIIAIDGPAGSGKSTLGRGLARRLDLLYVDSGAVYRAVGWRALYSGVSLDDGPAVAQIARDCKIVFEGDPDTLRMLLDGRDVTPDIRTPEASHASSAVATIPEVREAVVDKLRQMTGERGVVMDGRDIGTAVFPAATLKVFLEASAEVRAHRRRDEEVTLGREVSVEDVRAEIDRRDRRDRERSATPLVKADDAILIDTSNVDAGALLERVLEIVKSRR